MSTPESWVTVQEAAQITGASESQIRTAARRIKPGRSYTIYGHLPAPAGRADVLGEAAS
jgi:hypothetical protein